VSRLRRPPILHSVAETLATEMRLHVAEPFPDSVEKGLCFGEVDAVMIGADIYGWATRAGSLSELDRSCLSQAADELQRSIGAFHRTHSRTTSASCGSLDRHRRVSGSPDHGEWRGKRSWRRLAIQCGSGFSSSPRPDSRWSVADCSASSHLNGSARPWCRRSPGTSPATPRRAACPTARRRRTYRLP